MILQLTKSIDFAVDEVKYLKSKGLCEMMFT